MPNPDIVSITAPAPLRGLPAWLVWKFERGAETKPRKVPYYANGGRRHGVQGTAEDRRQLTTFEVAKAAAARRGFDGIGLALLPDLGICALDFDGCVTGGRVRPDVLAAVADTYAELSPSTTGVRAFVTGVFGNRKDHDAGVELFSSAGFVTVTGRALPLVEMLGLADTIAEPTPALRALIAQCFGREEPAEAGDAPPLGLTEAQLRECLDVLDPSMRHDPWLHLLMAVHHETGGSDAGFAIVDEWSSRGVQYPGSAALRARWDSMGRGGQKPVTAHALVRAANEAGAHIDLTAIAADDFEVAPGAPPPARQRFAVLTVPEFLQRPRPTWIVKKVLPDGDVVIIYGPPGSGKSFVALDLVGAVARGVPWRGLKVRQQRVVYVAAEGVGGFRNRVEAYQVHHGVSPALLVIDAAPNLLLHQDAVDVAKAIVAAGGADVVVIDTLAQTTPGANENTSEDMGKALAHCRGIGRALGGALVILIHHIGKDASKGARGWSGLKGAADAELEIVKTPAGRVIRMAK